MATQSNQQYTITLAREILVYYRLEYINTQSKDCHLSIREIRYPCTGPKYSLTA